MKVVIVFVALALMGCAGTAPVGARPTPSEPDPDMKASSYLGALSRWAMEPWLWFQECNKIDPSGAKAREGIYEAWLTKSKADIVRVDELRGMVGNELFPKMKARGAEPAEMLRAKTTVELSKLFYFMEPAKKAALCANFAALPPMNSAMFSAMKKEAFIYLDGWLATRRGEAK